MEYKKLYNSFLNYLYVIKNFSVVSIKSYGYILKEFLFFLETKYTSNINEVSKDMIIHYLFFTCFYKENLVSTRNKKLSVIKSFFNFLNQDFNVKNVAFSIPFTKKNVKLPKYLSEKEISEFLSVITPKNFRNYKKTYCIFYLFLNTGLRCRELTHIKLEDIKLEENKILIHGKGNKERICYLNSNTAKILKDYILSSTLNVYLFPNSEDKPIHDNNIEKQFRRILKLSSLENRGYTVHTLRHTFATRLYSKGVDTLVLKELLGHSSITSTKIYTHLNDEKTKEVFTKNPLANVLIKDLSREGEEG